MNTVSSDQAWELTAQIPQLLSSISNEISDLMLVDRKTKRLKVYRSSGNALGVQDALHAEPLYAEIVAAYIENNVHTKDQPKVREMTALPHIEEMLSKMSYYSVHYRVVRNNKLHYFQAKFSKCGLDDAFDSVLISFWNEDELEEERNRQLSLETDPTSGVLTEEAFRIECRRILREHPDEVYHFVVADIKHFRLINSINGQSAADDLLRALGSFLESQSEFLRIGRLSGDQFMGLVRREAPLDDRWGKNMTEAFAAVSPLPDVCLKWGIYNRVDHTQPMSVIYDRALFALKSIKNDFTQTSSCFDDASSMQLYKRQLCEARFFGAIQNHEFVVWYQPKFDPYIKQIVGAEALVRWFVNGAMVPPGEFLPVLEEDGLIAQLDAYVFEQVCVYQKKRMELGKRLIPISINLSRVSMLEGNVGQKYSEIARRYGVNPQYLPIEITESSAVQCNEISTIVQEMRSFGFPIHLDDFGSGHSSLYSLNSLDVDVIKLDRGLINYIGDKTGDTTLYHTIVMANDLNLHVVAEGVENKEQLDFLMDKGCDSIQGYYFSRPLAEDAFDKLIGQTNREEAVTDEAPKKLTLVHQLNKQSQIINSLNGIYYAIYYIEIADGSFHRVSSNARMNKLLGAMGDAHEAVNQTVEFLVREEYKQGLREFLDFTTVNQRIAGRKILTHDFEGIYTGPSRVLLIPVDRDADGTVHSMLYALRQLDEELLDTAPFSEEFTRALSQLGDVR